MGAATVGMRKHTTYRSHGSSPYALLSHRGKHCQKGQKERKKDRPAGLHDGHVRTLRTILAGHNAANTAMHTNCME